MYDGSDKWHKEIALFFKKKGISANSVEKECGLGSGTFAKFLRGYSDIGASKLRKIILRYDIDPYVIFKGDSKPSMIHDPAPTYQASKDTVTRDEFEKLKNEYEGYRKAMQDVLANQSQAAPLEQPPGKIYENSIQHRFCQLIDEIKEYELFENDTQVAKRIRVKPQILADYKAGRRNFTIEFLTKVLSSFDFIDANTLNWLFTGKGEILTDRKVDLSIKVVKDTEVDTDEPKTTP